MIIQCTAGCNPIDEGEGVKWKKKNPSRWILKHEEGRLREYYIQ